MNQIITLDFAAFSLLRHMRRHLGRDVAAATVRLAQYPIESTARIPDTSGRHVQVEIDADEWDRVLKDGADAADEYMLSTARICISAETGLQ